MRRRWCSCLQLQGVIGVGREAAHVVTIGFWAVVLERLSSTTCTFDDKVPIAVNALLILQVIKLCFLTSMRIGIKLPFLIIVFIPCPRMKLSTWILLAS